MAAFVTPCFSAYEIRDCLYSMVCVILFIADRVAPAFRFCLSNSTLTQATSIRYLFILFLSHIIVSPTLFAEAAAFFARLSPPHTPSAPAPHTMRRTPQGARPPLTRRGLSGAFPKGRAAYGGKSHVECYFPPDSPKVAPSKEDAAGRKIAPKRQG